MNQLFIDVMTDLTAIAGIPTLDELEARLDKHDASGFIRIARDLIPKVEAIRNAHDELVEACKGIVKAHEHFNQMLAMKLPDDEIVGAMDALMDSNVAILKAAIAKVEGAE